VLIAELPTGTVTFLFTDIEGSTRLWEEHPSAMRPALASHDELIASAVANNGGHLIKSTGDGAYAVFDRAVNAAATAVEAQRRFQEELFQDVGHLKVRMALHTGEADERQGDYFGPALNRAARLLGTGHGGQILVSAATWEVLGQGDYDFIDLGEHRLRDLTRPERVHQLTYSGLPTQFAPLLSVDAHPNNLPLQLTSFVGRDQERHEIATLLEAHRLVSLTGVGGAGKTRLALQVASDLLDSSPEGAWLVELAPIKNPGLVVSQVAAPFGVREIETDSKRALVDVLSDYLSQRDLLLLLDNCEHVIEEAARVSEELLTRCPDIKILATSRGLLGVPGETLYPVPPMGLHGDPDGREDTDAMFLFVERAAHVQPGFNLNDDNTEALRQITQRLDGLPLAIELAASRINVLTPSEILARLDDQLRLITSKRRGDGRHSTLEAAMDWSYDLLTPPEQTLFRELSVFAGGWSLEAVDAVSSSDEDVLEALGELVDQSLVEVSDQDGFRRYRLLESVRQYAASKLSTSAPDYETRRRHAEFFATLGEEGDAALKGPDQDRWSLRLKAEHDNMRSAIEWSLENEEHELALRLTSAMGWFWWLRGHWKEANRWFWRVYDATSEADPLLRGRLVYKVASLEIQRARPGEVRPLFEEALAMFREKGSDLDVAWTAVFLVDVESAIELGRESLDLFASLGETWGEAYARFMMYGELVALASDAPHGLAEMQRAIDTFLDLGDRWTAAWMGFQLGQMYAYQGEYDQARRMIQQSADLVEGTNDRWIAPHCTSRLGILATMTGASEEAKALFDEALPVHQRIGDQNCTALIHTYMGELLTDEGNYTEAAEHLTLGVKGYEDLQNRYGMVNSVRRMGWLALAEGDKERAARLLGAADGLREDLGGFISVHDAKRDEDLTARLRDQIDAEQMDGWWAEGKVMSQEERISYALGSEGSTPR